MRPLNQSQMMSTLLSWKEIFIVYVLNLLEHIFISILHMKGGMKCYMISIALIAQLVEQQVLTLKARLRVQASLGDSIFFNN